MDIADVKPFEKKPVYFGFDWKCSNAGFAYGFVSEGECYNFSIVPPDKPSKITISRVPRNYLTFLEEPRIQFSDFELALFEALRSTDLNKMSHIHGISVEIHPPYRE